MKIKFVSSQKSPAIHNLLTRATSIIRSNLSIFLEYSLSRKGEKKFKTHIDTHAHTERKGYQDGKWNW